MSTTIKSAAGHGSLTMDADRASVELSHARTDGAPGSIFDRAVFLAAVEAECGVIVIDRASLPKTGLTSDGSEVYAGDGTPGTRWWQWGHGADAARSAALAYLAIAEHIDAHPPVDEAQVEALADLIMTNRREVDGRPLLDQYRDLARAFIATGRIEVKP